jgi:hypothetical protein
MNGNNHSAKRFTVYNDGGKGNECRSEWPQKKENQNNRTKECIKCHVTWTDTIIENNHCPQCFEEYKEYKEYKDFSEVENTLDIKVTE